MGILPWRRRSSSTTTSPTRAQTLAHFRDFVGSRVGVEAFVEPATTVHPTTVVLVARTGEWTRRAVPDVRAAWGLARDLAIPIYDVQLTGYPQRMRQWTAERRAAGRGSDRPAD